MTTRYDIIVIGGGHAGAEAAWAAANLLREDFEADRDGTRKNFRGKVALVTMDPARIGQMSCNPAIGGLAKGQMVREIDALGGLMGLAIDATGIQFRVLNRSKGPAVRGPRAQADKYAYAREVQRLLGTRPNLDILSGTVDDLIVENNRCTGVVFMPVARDEEQPEWTGHQAVCCSEGVYPQRINAGAVVLTTGTFMRGLMHTGESQTRGGRVDEQSAEGISGSLSRLGFELGRLKTGTPPRLAAETIDFDGLDIQPGDDPPVPFSEMTQRLDHIDLAHATGTDRDAYAQIARRFPVFEQHPCWVTRTNATVHDAIRANLDRAPMYNGQIETAGPRYCPSIEDKVVRFADKESHHVFLEPESLETNEIYCNGISTSLPLDVQEVMVRNMPGCERATILRAGYAVEYDMVRPHQIDATCMTKRVAGLLLAGQINGTSGYEEAAAQGLLAGLNAVRYTRGEDPVRFDRDQAYIGVMMDDLVTKVPVEPYRMFTSRAEHRLLLRSDNAPDRLTELGRAWGLVDDARWQVHEQTCAARDAIVAYLTATPHDGARMIDWIKRPEVTEQQVAAKLDAGDLPALSRDARLIGAVLSDQRYAGFIDRHLRDHEKVEKMEHTHLPTDLDYAGVGGLRNEAREVLNRFRPATLGQASRLAGINPADLTVLAMTVAGR